MRSGSEKTIRSWLLCSAVLFATVAPVDALIVGGGGSARTDCLAVFDAEANTPTRRPRTVRCVDGDPCDTDGMIDGQCSFPVAVCANSTSDPRCTLRGVEEIEVAHARDDGDPKFDPDFQAIQERVTAGITMPGAVPDQCGLPTTVHVVVRGPFGRRNRCARGRKRIRVEAISTLQGRRVRVDRDRLLLVCEPAPDGCSPRALFAGTFDRIQRQIFNQSCALSGCHDSESEQAQLLLEPGAAHANLVGVVPSNGPAAGAGWRRVNVLAPGSGDPTTSLLLRKLTGDLPAGFGDRMPLDGRRVDRGLVDVIRLWIESGAPADGWVPGTD